MTPRRNPTAPSVRRVPGVALALAAGAAFAAFGLAGGPAAVPAGAPHLVSEVTGMPDGPGEAPACDVAALATGLVEDPERAAAWAGVRGIAPEEAGAFFVTLSPVALDGDAAFTRFTYADGGYLPEQAEFPAGTEVLVDGEGVPAATCDAGDPLTALTEEPAPAEDPGPAPEPYPGEFDPGHPIDEPGMDEQAMDMPGPDGPGHEMPPGEMGEPGHEMPPGEMGPGEMGPGYGMPPAGMGEPGYGMPPADMS